MDLAAPIDLQASPNSSPERVLEAMICPIDMRTGTLMDQKFWGSCHRANAHAGNLTAAGQSLRTR